MLKSYTGIFVSWVKELPGQLGRMVCYRRDGKFYPELWICILFALLVIPAGMFCPVEYGYENGVVERVMEKVKPDTNAAEILEYLSK